MSSITPIFTCPEWCLDLQKCLATGFSSRSFLEISLKCSYVRFLIALLVSPMYIWLHFVQLIAYITFLVSHVMLGSVEMCSPVMGLVKVLRVLTFTHHLHLYLLQIIWINPGFLGPSLSRGGSAAFVSKFLMLLLLLYPRSGGFWKASLAIEAVESRDQCLRMIPLISGFLGLNVTISGILSKVFF